MSRDLVIGLDLSLAETGVSDGHSWCESVKWPGKSPAGYGHDRLSFIAASLRDFWRGARLVVIEGPAYGSQAIRQSGHHERAGLWWMVAHELWRAGIPYAVVPPNIRAKYATGKAGAGKDAVLLAASRRWPAVPISNNNEADAVVIAAMGRDHLGLPITPVPATHRSALSSVEWPDLLAPAA